MATVLHIQASPMGDLSYSKRLARAFLDSYGSAHREDRIVTLDLWKETLPPFDFVAASGKYKIIRGMPHSEEEASAWKKVLEMIDQFKGADKVVVSTGMWNFSIPYRLKQYLDVIVQPGHPSALTQKKATSGWLPANP